MADFEHVFEQPPEGAAADWTIPQNWAAYTDIEHQTWDTLYDRQMKILPGRACDPFMNGLKALDLNTGGIPDFERAASLGLLPNLARLYWYTVEFGLMREKGDLRIYGAGIVSSATESVFAVEDPSPNRIGFDLERVMKTLYRIDDFQQVYFVIDSFEQLKRDTLQDFGPVYERLKGAGDIAIDAILPGDEVITRGTQAYAEKGGRFAA